MPVYVNNSGTWTLSKEIYVNDGGTWKEPQEVYVNDAGTWKIKHKVVYISSDTANINLYTLAGSPSNALRLKVIINSGVNIYSSTPTSPSLSATSFPAGSEILLINNGNIEGAGGAAGRGADYGGAGGNGANGGTALYTEVPITVQNNGSIYGGGGGGGGGGYYSTSSSCFPGDTQVSTPNGLVSIRDLKVGDLVYAFNPTSFNGLVSAKRITEIFTHTWEESGSVSPLLVINHEHGVLTTTVNHHILTSSRKSSTEEAEDGFVQADELQVDDIIYTEDGKESKILEINPGSPYDFVYNLSVDDFHTFIADGVRVHNKGGGKGTSYYYYGGGGGGGGAGIVNGIAGTEGTGSSGNGTPGSNGSNTAGGAGGSSGGGSGGSLGNPGNTGGNTSPGLGGAAGNYIQGNSNVTWQILGTVAGQVV
jgi:hypothetical protein